MNRLQNWLKDHKYQAHVTAFLLMILPAVPLYFAAGAGSQFWIILLLAVIVCGNILAVLVR
jgi:hypothetical protein